MIHNCPINSLFAAEQLLAFGTISQSLSQRGDTPSRPRCSVLYLPSCSVCLCTEAESSSLITIIWMRDGVIISQVPSLWPHQKWKVCVCVGGGLCYHDDLMKLVKVRPVKPKTWSFCVVFFPPLWPFWYANLAAAAAVVGRGMPGEQWGMKL